MKFDIQTHAWLYNDSLWKRMTRPTITFRGGGGLAENASLPNTDCPMWTTFHELPEWIGSIYLKPHDRTYIVGLLGKSVIIS